jgi:hypothetical protein
VKLVGAHSASQIGLAKNPKGVHFQCGTCEYFDRGVCHNENPALHARVVEPEWCCNLYWNHKGIKVIR